MFQNKIDEYIFNWFYADSSSNVNIDDETIFLSQFHVIMYL